MSQLNTDDEEEKEIQVTPEWNQISCSEKTKLVGKEIWSRIPIYLSPILHLSDAVSDYAALTEFHIVASESTTDECS